MAKLPQVRPRQVKKALEKLGWVEVRSVGSHRIFKRKDFQFLVTVPWHTGTVAPGTLRSILSAAELSVDEFVSAL